MTDTDEPRRDLEYRLGYATELIRQIVAHIDNGDQAALLHSLAVTRRFLAKGPDQ